ncbi:sugar transferase [Pseudarthrobacter sp. H3Y2-7]|uniref:sugar transferase n=1 Tax=Pseudarthrobacter naphthalenicus TaxID=3031328 RepID=UPI0023AEB515|nr:sugar transferase [Pseudarthrobacter sp. H3Y2-7]MDE8668154.1 sugar transferase [Pseudarthrobacter sp. H3Y2-7]
MHILIVSQWFDPEPTFKGLLFAKELQRQGHQVSVLTGFPNYPGGKIYPGYRVRPFQREVIQGIPVNRVALYPSHDSSGIRRALNYASFAASASIGALLVQRPDVAYVYHPPATVGIPALVLKVLRGVPFVYDVQDLWPETLAATGMIRGSSVLSFVDRAMLGVYRMASRIAVLSEGFGSALKQKGVPAGRIDVIPNWADEAQINLETRSPVADSNWPLGLGDKFTVTFAGNLGKAQALETVLDAAELLRDQDEVRFLLIGAGVEATRLAGEAERRDLDNVIFIPRQPISKIGDFLSRSDALLVHLRNDPLFEITVPSKTQAYLMAGRPILMGVKGDAAAMIEEAGAGIAFEPECAADLAEAVRNLMSRTPGERQALGVSGARYYAENLALKVGAERFSRSLFIASLSKPRVLGVKRLLDVVFSALALATLAVPMGVVAVLIRKKLGSPVFFRQIRPGRDGKLFEMYKFRTMTDARDVHGRLLPDSDRLTRFGSLLRITSFDELPELWNVLKGQMSLVGPRPLLTRYSEYFTEEESLRTVVRPGITGWAQVNGRNTSSWSDRLAHDVRYVKSYSLGFDAKILILTALKVFRRQGVVVDPESIMQNLDDERRGAKTT